MATVLSQPPVPGADMVFLLQSNQNILNPVQNAGKDMAIVWDYFIMLDLSEIHDNVWDLPLLANSAECR